MRSYRAASMRAVLLAAMVLAPVSAKAQRDDAVSKFATPPVAYPAGVTGLRDVPYAEIDGFRPLTMDLYLPQRTGPMKPAIIFVHGGSWRHRTAKDGGTFADFPAILAHVAARGYVVASVNYRLSGETKFPGPVQDVARSIAWLRLHAAEYGIDPARVVLWGSSAGGQIANLIGTGCDAPLVQPPPLTDKAPKIPSICVQGVIDWYGVVDLEHLASDLAPLPDPVTASVNAYLGCAPEKCPAGLARSASALAYIDAHDPPFLIQHGTADATVSPKQAQHLYDGLRKAGVPAEIIYYPNVSHGFARVPGGGPDDAVNRAALDAVYKWLARYFPVSAG